MEDDKHSRLRCFGNFLLVRLVKIIKILLKFSTSGEVCLFVFSINGKFTELCLRQPSVISILFLGLHTL